MWVVALKIINVIKGIYFMNNTKWIFKIPAIYGTMAFAGVASVATININEQHDRNIVSRSNTTVNIGSKGTEVEY